MGGDKMKKKKMRKAKRKAEAEEAKKQEEEAKEQEEPEDSGDDEIEDLEEDGEENAEEEIMKEQEKRSAKRKRDGRYSIPTREEMSHLRDTENLFQSNLLRLEINELLPEVKPNYTKSKPLEALLFKIKGMFDCIPAQTVSARSFAKCFPGIRSMLKTHTTRETDLALDFEPPSRLDLVGSYLLQTSAKPNLNIDVAVEMPQECLLARDHVNYRYFDKRALYLAVLAKGLQQFQKKQRALLQKSKGKKGGKENDTDADPSLIDFEIRFACLNDDPFKPILVLHPILKKKDAANRKARADPALDMCGVRARRGRAAGVGGGTGASASGFSIRIIPCVSESSFKWSQLVPDHNNVRRPGSDDSDSSNGSSSSSSSSSSNSSSPLPPTPHYNNAVLEDMSFTRSLAQLHSAVSQGGSDTATGTKTNSNSKSNINSNSNNFRDACVLCKIWLVQRQLDQSSDSFNGFLMSMLLLYLMHTKKVNRHMSPQQIFRTLMQFLAKADPNAQPWCMPLSAEVREQITQVRAQQRQQKEAEKKKKQQQGGDAGTAAAAAATASRVTVTDGAAEVVREMQKAFAVVFVDSSGVMNLAGRVSDSAWAEVQIEARRSLILLHEHHNSSAGGGGVASFQHLFLQRTDFWLQYDQYCWLAPMPSDDTSATGKERGQLGNYLLDFSRRAYWPRRLVSLLKQALSTRVTQLRPLLLPLGEWRLDEPNPPCDQQCVPPMCLGITLNASEASRVADRGPEANSKDARQWRGFWGSKSELRRFKDGRVLEAVVWQLPLPQRHLIVGQIIEHILGRHEPKLMVPKTVTASHHTQPLSLATGQVQQLLLVGKQTKGKDGLQDQGKGIYKNKNKNNSTGKSSSSRQEMEEATPLLLQSFQSLSKILTSLTGDQVSRGRLAGLPLRISSLQPISPEFRYTSLWPPMQHPLAMIGASGGGGGSGGGSGDAKSVGTVVHPLELVLTFESTTDWPDEVHAIRATKTALYLQLAALLRTHHSSTVRVIVTRTFLDVLFCGYAFRIHIYVAREVTLLRQHRETLALIHRTAKSAGGGHAGADGFPVPRNLTREKLGLVEYGDAHKTKEEKNENDDENEEEEEEDDEEPVVLGVGDALARVSRMADSMFKKFEVLPVLHGALHTLHTSHPSFGPACRLAKRWLHSQGLLDAPGTGADGFDCSGTGSGAGGAGSGASGHMEEVAVELLVARVYCHPHPYSAPHTAQAGFMRFLDLLSSWEWGTMPMVVKLLASNPEETVEGRYGVETDAGDIMAELERKSKAMAASAKIERGLLSAIQQKFASVRGSGSGKGGGGFGGGTSSAGAGALSPMYLVALVQQPHTQKMTAQINANPFAKSLAAQATHTNFSTLMGKDGGPLAGAQAAAVAAAGATTPEAAAMAARWAVLGQEHEPLWTEQRPEAVVLRRMCACAKQSLSQIRSWVGGKVEADVLRLAWGGTPRSSSSKARNGKEEEEEEAEEETQGPSQALEMQMGLGAVGKSWQKAFVPQIVPDVRLIIDPQLLPSGASANKDDARADVNDGGGRLRGAKRFRVSLYKNLLRLPKNLQQDGNSNSNSKMKVMVGFDPLNQYVQMLRLHFGHLALFFLDAFGGTSVDVVWRPQSEKPFHVTKASYAMPVAVEDSDNGTNTNSKKRKKPKVIAVPNIQEVLAEFRMMGEGLISHIEIV